MSTKFTPRIGSTAVSCSLFSHPSCQLPSNRVGATLAFLKTLAPVEQRIELLLTLPVERHSDRAALIEPRAAYHRESSPLHSVFNGFLCDVVELAECREWRQCAWQVLPGLLLAFRTNWARKPG